MRSAGIRNKPVDRRYLSDQDKSDYNQSGAYGKRAQAVGRARAYRGNLAYAANAPQRTVVHTPGTGGMGVGLGAQIQRNQEIGTQNARMEGFKPEKVKNIYKDIYK